MKKAVVLTSLLLLTATVAACGGSTKQVLYACQVAPDTDFTPLLAAAREGAGVLGFLPSDDMRLGCEPPKPGDRFVHVVAPRSYIRAKTGADSGWGSSDQVLIELASLHP